MEISKTNLTTAIRYLEDAAKLCKPLASSSTKTANKIRLINNLINKLNSKLNDKARHH